eukprot:COSAG05_NODE_331_length_11273_cov_3.896635_12_plen_160_part_00
MPQSEFNAEAAAVAAANCTFGAGEGVGDWDLFMGEYQNASLCAAAVAGHHPGANGATYSAPGTGSGCWAEFGMRYASHLSSGSTKWISCIFAMAPSPPSVFVVKGNGEGAPKCQASTGVSAVRCCSDAVIPGWRTERNSRLCPFSESDATGFPCTASVS